MPNVSWKIGINTQGGGAGPVNPAQQVQGYTLNSEGIQLCYNQDIIVVKKTIKDLKRDLSNLSHQCTMAQVQAAVKIVSRKDLIKPDTRDQINELKQQVEAKHGALCNLLKDTEFMIRQHEENMRPPAAPGVAPAAPGAAPAAPGAAPGTTPGAATTAPGAAPGTTPGAATTAPGAATTAPGAAPGTTPGAATTAPGAAPGTTPGAATTAPGAATTAPGAATSAP